MGRQRQRLLRDVRGRRLRGRVHVLRPSQWPGASPLRLVAIVRYHVLRQHVLRRGRGIIIMLAPCVGSRHLHYSYCPSGWTDLGTGTGCWYDSAVPAGGHVCYTDLNITFAHTSRSRFTRAPGFRLLRRERGHLGGQDRVRFRRLGGLRDTDAATLGDPAALGDAVPNAVSDGGGRGPAIPSVSNSARCSTRSAGWTRR